MEPFIDKVLGWAERQPDVRAVLLVGSRARSNPPPDQFSDFDFEIYTTLPDSYWEVPDWLGTLGHLWLCLPHTRGDGVAEHLVLYDDAVKIDLSFLPIAWLREMVQTQRLTTVYLRGYRVLLDKDGLAAQLPPAAFHPGAERPSLDTFTRTVNAFWYGAVYVAKQIRRRNLWTVKYRDWTMKEELLTMLEWQAQARSGWQADTWYEGKYLLDWTDGETAAALEEVFGKFDAADSRRALLATMELFRRAAMETAVALDYPYPHVLDQNVAQYVAEFLASV